MSFDLSQKIDRRLWERFPARFPAKLKDERSDFGENLTLCDASATGIRFLSKERFYVHDSVALEVKVPDGQNPMYIKGEVVWVRQRENGRWEIGLRFFKFDFIRLTRLYKFIQPSIN